MYDERLIDSTEKFEINHLTVHISKEAKNKLKNIKMYQLADEKLKWIVDTIEANKHHKLTDKYNLHNNKLYRKEKGPWKLMLTKDLSRTLVYELHNVYSHVGN